jgi:acyl-CoA dehydrogenase
MARAAAAALAALENGGDDDGFLRGKVATARFYADHELSRASALVHAATAGAAGTLALADDAI